MHHIVRFAVSVSCLFVVVCAVWQGGMNLLAGWAGEAVCGVYEYALSEFTVCSWCRVCVSCIVGIALAGCCCGLFHRVL